MGMSEEDVTHIITQRKENRGQQKHQLGTLNATTKDMWQEIALKLGPQQG